MDDDILTQTFGPIELYEEAQMQEDLFMGGTCSFCKKRFWHIKIVYENLKLKQYFQFCSHKCYAFWCKGV